MDGKKIALAALLALALLGGILSADCQSYNESCASAPCCDGLVCDTAAHVCTQDTSVCTNLPASYVFTSTSESAGGPGSPVSLIEQQIAGGENATIKSTSNLYKVGWFSDWTIAGLLGVAATISIIALAALAGYAFNLPDVKAFADAEIMQAIVSVLLIASLLGLVGFFDSVAREALATAGLPIACVQGEPCYITAAKYYLDTLYETASQYSYDELKESIRTQKAASQGIAAQLNFWQLFYAGSNIRLDAWMSIMGERAGAIFETVSKLMASIYAQRYFIDVVAYGIAPVFMLLGIVLRTFFFTRKLGGLLLAIAISLFIIYPLTYAFAWYTLNVTIYGERLAAVSDPACPNECTARYPAAFFVGENGALVKFETTQDIMLAGINNTNWNSGGPDLNGDGKGDFPGLVACRNLSMAGLSESIAVNQCVGCPDYCREVPFPSNLPGCNIAACSNCNAGCKIMRVRTDCRTNPDLCPSSCTDPANKCRTALPVENKCYDANEGAGSPAYVEANLSVSCAGCDGCPYWCRYLNASDELVYANEPACQVSACKLSNCPVQCMYKTMLGKSANCDASCSYSDSSGAYVCPKSCRLAKLFPYNSASGTAADEAWMREYDIGNRIRDECTSDLKIVKACNNCLPGCLIPVPDANISKCAPYPSNYGAKYCTECPEYCRWQDYSFISPYSNLEKDATDPSKPYMCTKDANPALDCDQSPPPAACNASCFSTDYPPTCRQFWGRGEGGYCGSCPLSARTTLVHTNASGLTDYNGPPLLDDGYSCNDTSCEPACKLVPPSIVPNSSTPSGGGATLRCSIGLNEECEPDAAFGNCCTGGYSCRESEDTQEYAASPGFSPGVDYIISYVYTRDNVTVGDSFEVKVNTTNRGTIGASAASNTSVAFDGMAANISVAMLGAGASHQGSATMSCNSPGAHQLTITADAGNNVGEANETNNELTITVNCAEPAIYKCYACQNTVGEGGYCDAATAGCCAEGLVCANNKCSVPVCMDYDAGYEATRTEQPKMCEMCPVGCRLNVVPPDNLDNQLNSSCTSASLAKSPGTFNPCDSDHCPNTCKAAALPTGSTPICEEYLGNGPLGTDEACYGPTYPVNCPLIDNNVSCIGNASYGCMWLQENSSRVPIIFRSPPYNDPSNCKQCPENCRITGLDGTCGQEEGTVDCSEEACPSVCRRPVTINDTCQEYNAQNANCKDCPALCRRNQETEQPNSCKGNLGCSAESCTSECWLDAAPAGLCSSCFDCPLDCTYYPAVRSDCSEVCSDEALAGPVNVAPDDFIKALPGAAGEADAKNVGLLMVPALVLPLFCIVIVVAFIRVFSPLLGGDIEIPGLGRII